MWRPCEAGGRIRISPGFCLLAAWFALENGWGVLWTVLGAAAIHELGHWGVLYLLGTPVTGLRIGLLGAEMTADRRGMSYPGELAAVLAGPGANLLCAAALTAAGGTRWAAAVGANVVLCAFNLLPVRPLDGGRALYLLTACALGPEAGEQAVRWIGGIVALGLSAALVWVMVRTGGSLWLLPPAAGLLAAAAGRDRG